MCNTTIQNFNLNPYFFNNSNNHEIKFSDQSHIPMNLQLSSLLCILKHLRRVDY